MIRVGLTGGMGAGKSTVLETFADLGAAIVDHDLLARDAVAVGTPGLRRIHAVFGPDVIDGDGALNRHALAAIVFGDDDARRDLEQIVHPEVRRLAAEAEAKATAAGADVVVHDIPLLIETGQEDNFDYVVVVRAPLAARLARLVERGVDEADARRRIAAQLPDATRVAHADIVIDNSGDIEDLRRAVRAAWDTMTATDSGD